MPDEALFQQLRDKLVGAGLGVQEQTQIMEAIDDMESAKGTPKFKEKYQGFIAAAANHAGIFGTLLAALSMYI
ncbi:MAG: hypothetical protein GXP03_02430 [Alphaproteobacteria bacterium]|nr:hypothetical protein [Alphaproteobacteria bacterium]